MKGTFLSYLSSFLVCYRHCNLSTFKFSFLFVSICYFFARDGVGQISFFSWGIHGTNIVAPVRTGNAFSIMTAKTSLLAKTKPSNHVLHHRTLRAYVAYLRDVTVKFRPESLIFTWIKHFPLYVMLCLSRDPAFTNANGVVFIACRLPKVWLC
jgi:hypothetical protein